MLQEFCDSIRPLAAERNLFLKAEGPGALPVIGDSVKILRIAQNLVLNALKVTEHGGVCVQWEERPSSGPPQWVLCVQDTGPGFQPQSPAAPLESALRQATREAQQLDAGAGAHAAAERSDAQVAIRSSTRSACLRAKASACRSSSDCASCSMPAWSWRPRPGPARPSAWCCRAPIPRTSSSRPEHA
jgi:light-regulated signal transduction histidine kinase (bacteriophytochrome)